MDIILSYGTAVNNSTKKSAKILKFAKIKRMNTKIIKIQNYKNTLTGLHVLQ